MKISWMRCVEVFTKRWKLWTFICEAYKTELERAYGLDIVAGSENINFYTGLLRFEWLTPLMKVITSLGNSGIFWIVFGIGHIVYKKIQKRRI